MDTAAYALTAIDPMAYLTRSFVERIFTIDPSLHNKTIETYNKDLLRIMELHDFETIQDFYKALAIE